MGYLKAGWPRYSMGPAIVRSRTTLFPTTWESMYESIEFEVCRVTVALACEMPLGWRTASRLTGFGTVGVDDPMYYRLRIKRSPTRLLRGSWFVVKTDSLR